MNKRFLSTTALAIVAVLTVPTAYCVSDFFVDKNDKGADELKLQSYQKR